MLLPLDYLLCSAPVDASFVSACITHLPWIKLTQLHTTSMVHLVQVGPYGTVMAHCIVVSVSKGGGADQEVSYCTATPPYSVTCKCSPGIVAHSLHLKGHMSIASAQPICITLPPVLATHQPALLCASVSQSYSLWFCARACTVTSWLPVHP